MGLVVLYGRSSSEGCRRSPALQYIKREYLEVVMRESGGVLLDPVGMVGDAGDQDGKNRWLTPLIYPGPWSQNQCPRDWGKVDVGWTIEPDACLVSGAPSSLGAPGPTERDAIGECIEVKVHQRAH